MFKSHPIQDHWLLLIRVPHSLVVPPTVCKPSGAPFLGINQYRICKASTLSVRWPLLFCFLQCWLIDSYVLACDQNVNVTFSFGGKAWPISPDDFNLGTLGGGMCLGAIFDLGLGSSIGNGGGNPSWVVGDTFLVRTFDRDIVTVADLAARKTCTLSSAPTPLR